MVVHVVVGNANIDVDNCVENQDIKLYRHNTKQELSKVAVDHELILCDNPKCADPAHLSAIDRMYNNVTRTSALLVTSAELKCGNKSKAWFKQVLLWNTL